MLDTEHGYCLINIVDIRETEYNEYMELLKQEGFSVIEEVSEEIKGQDYVSIGTLLSNEEKGDVYKRQIRSWAKREKPKYNPADYTFEEGDSL